jgi:hypothetical protein
LLHDIVFPGSESADDIIGGFLTMMAYIRVPLELKGFQSYRKFFPIVSLKHDTAQNPLILWAEFKISSFSDARYDVAYFMRRV